MAEQEPIPLRAGAMLTTRVEPGLVAVQPIAIDLDERAFLFPAGKCLTRLVLSASGRMVHFDAVFGFNETRTPPRLFSLLVDDVRHFGQVMVETVYLARTQHAITETMRITIDVLPNGYRWQLGDLNTGQAVFFGTGSVWRVCQGLLRIIDQIGPVEAH